MCGIAFLINYGTEPFDPAFLGRVFANMDDRGGDASGYYFERPKKGKMIRRLVKAPVLGEDLFKDMVEPSGDVSKAEKAFNSKYSIIGDERLVILHTRKRTQGTEANNHNNMPIFSRNWTMVHNGVVTAERLQNYPYKGQVDSEEILARIEMYSGDLFRVVPEISGSMAIIAKHFKSDDLLIYRNHNPLDLVFQPERKILVGVSCAEYAIEFDQREDYNSIFKETGVASCQTTPNFVYRVSLKEPDIKCLGKVESKIRSGSSVTISNKVYNRGCED